MFQQQFLPRLVTSPYMREAETLNREFTHMIGPVTGLISSKELMEPEFDEVRWSVHVLKFL